MLQPRGTAGGAGRGSAPSDGGTGGEEGLLRNREEAGRGGRREREMDERDTGRGRETHNGRGRGRGLDKEKLAITVGLSYNPVVLCRHHRRLVLRPGGDT